MAKKLKENLFYSYIIYLMEKFRIYCFFEVLEPLCLDGLKSEKVSLLKFRESFNKVSSLNVLRWSGLIYLVGSTDVKEFCVTLQNLIKSTPNVVFYHIYFERTRMVFGEFLMLFVNKLTVYIRIVKLLSLWSFFVCSYRILIRNLTGLLLLKICQQ